MNPPTTLAMRELNAGRRSARRLRLLGAIAIAGAVGVLVGGWAYALSVVRGGGYGSASTASLRLSLNADASQTCSFEALAPGDLDGTSTCTMTVLYTGSTPAFVSLTVGIRSRAGDDAGRTLYDGSGASGLTFLLSDGRHAFTVPTGPGAACAGGYTCWTAGNELAASYAAGDPLVFRNGNQVTFTVTPFFPQSADSSYQGGTADLTLTAEAVQAPANPLPPGCGTSTIGLPCPPNGTFTWS